METFSMLQKESKANICFFIVSLNKLLNKHSIDQ